MKERRPSHKGADHAQEEETKAAEAGADFPARYSVGNRVRVNPGTTVPDFEDIPLGGWVGAIDEVDQRSAPADLPDRVEPAHAPPTCERLGTRKHVTG